MSLLSVSTVFLLAAAPVGGLGAAIPAGLALGLHWTEVVLLTVIASTLPAVILPPLCTLATRHPRIAAWVARRRTERARRFFSRYGVWGMATIGRFVVGPYASVLTLELFGVSRRRALTAFALGSLGLSLLFAWTTLAGVALFR